LTVILTILIFLIVISLHEFGHFAVAKLLGVEVLEFAIGMGPAIWKKQKGETLYSLRIFPIGGYCKLEGEDEANDSPKAFCNQKLWKRLCVISAGAILNILLGFFVFLALVPMQGETITTTTIGSLEPRSHIAQTDIRPGDRIVKINGKKVHFFRDISMNLEDCVPGEALPVMVERDGKKLEFQITPSLQKVEQEFSQEGVWVRDTINGIEEKRFVAYSEELRTAAEESDYIGKTVSGESYILGFVPEKVPVSVWTVIPEAYHYTGFVIRMVYGALGDMITGKTGLEQMSGPVGVATAVNTAVNSAYGLENLLFLIGMLTINLGIFNLLPVPALDGGRIFFLLIELIRRKPIPPEREGMVHAIGLLLLLALAAVVFFNDIVRLL